MSDLCYGLCIDGVSVTPETFQPRSPVVYPSWAGPVDLYTARVEKYKDPDGGDVSPACVTYWALATQEDPKLIDRLMEQSPFSRDDAEWILHLAKQAFTWANELAGHLSIAVQAYRRTPRHPRLLRGDTDTIFLALSSAWACETTHDGTTPATIALARQLLARRPNEDA